MITVDAHTRKLEVHVSYQELEARKTKWEKPQARYEKGVLAKYAKLVSSSSVGAVTDSDITLRDT